ncbi:MAG: beta-aspartyl-peptidase [Candidatus Bipolaricaulota bacterium]|nr:beta-aspartyl-peptidase [Candidatus Bipolaricaulota bacterium]
MNNQSSFTLIKNGKLYDPRERGERDLLIGGDRIVKIAETIEVPEDFNAHVVDGSGKLIVPGFIDLHLHLTGGGGEAGPSSRVPEIPVSEIAEAGITTVVGTLGTDDVTRSVESLLAKAKGLNQHVTSYIYTGSYHLPSTTITGSVKKDIALIDKVIGVKVAISDHRSYQPNLDELKKLASEARVGGMIGNKPGIVHLHVGGGEAGLKPIREAVTGSEIPLAQFLPTHVGRSPKLLREGVDLVNRGGFIDVTCPSNPSDREETIESITRIFKEKDAPLENLTISSDGNGSMPKFDEGSNLVGLTKGKVTTLHKNFVDFVRSEALKLPEALTLITSNPARRLGIDDRKGSLEAGKDADLLVLSEDLDIEKGFAKGEQIVEDGKGVIEGPYE